MVVVVVVVVVMVVVVVVDGSEATVSRFERGLDLRTTAASIKDPSMTVATTTVSGRLL
jgi:hypothetical protein